MDKVITQAQYLTFRVDSVDWQHSTQFHEPTIRNRHCKAFNSLG